MSDYQPTDAEDFAEPPVAQASIEYLGPVSPHWEIRFDGGDEGVVDAFRTRVNARLMLLPPHDPQFRRNRERVNRDAERELIELTWELGDDDPGERPPRADRPDRADRAPR